MVDGVMDFGDEGPMSYSEEGSIKIWDSDKLLLTEIFLGGADHQGEIILSSACFLNNQGDLLVAYLNHIFIIDHTKVYPSADAPDLEEGYFDEESFVLEDSRVLYDDANDEPDSIDLQKYLVPFNIALSEDFLEGRRTIEHVVKEPVESNDDEEEEACDSTCGLSSAPSDIYLSPLTSPRQLSTVDILLCPKMDDQQLNIQKKKVTPGKKLSRKVRQKFLSKARKQPEVTWVEMPQFGSSPGTTPSPSLSSIDSPSPRASSITSDKENEECLQEETQVVEMQGEREDQSQEGENKMGTKSTSSTPAKQPARQPAKVTDQTYVKSKYSLDNIKVEPPKWAKTQPAPVQPKPFRPSNYTIAQKTEATSPQPKRELKKKLPSNNRKVVTSARSRSRRKSVARSDSQVSGISEVSKDMTAQRVHTPEVSGVVESEVSGENGVTHDASDMAYTGNDAARWGEGSQEDVLEASKEMLTQEEQNADLRDDAEKDTALPKSVSASSSTSGPRPLASTQVVQGGLSKGVTGQGSKDHSPAQHSRPSTAGQGQHDQDELWAMFENTLKHYRSRPGTPNSSELWYKNAGNIFEDSWHERMIERHQLLKLQTMLRVERAAHRRKIEDQRQQERRQSLHSHQHCTSPKMGDGDPDSRLHIFNWFGNANRVSQASGHPSSRLRRPKTAHAKLMGVDKQELSSVQPFRLRMNKSSTELSSKYSSVDLVSYDPRNQWAVRPHSSKSIPAKCRKYVLVQPPKEDGNVVASPMVESLLRKRFPNQLHPVSNPRSRSPTNTYPMSFSALIQQMSS
ncbi:uncharacterized protein LOC135470917 [Liolophura sinensis]|uniref:uncharacterized protein LOC135470917 n=1 Tax=Liolophura sinensis TaxID=3198878 RepID=UPI003158BC3C